MINCRKTGLINLLSVKTAVFTGILAGAMALSGCGAGPKSLAAVAGLAGAPGNDGKSGSAAKEVVSVGKYCTEFTFDGLTDGTETGANKRKFVVIAIDDKGVALPDQQLPDQPSDPKGCITNLEVIKGHLNKVTVYKTTGGNENISFLYNATEKAGGSAQVSGSGHKMDLTAGDVTEYILRMANTQVYDVTKIHESTYIELYDDMGQCSDFKDDYKSGVLGAGTKLGAGTQSIIKCLQANPVLMKKLTQANNNIFKASDGKFANRELDDTGSSLSSNTSFLGNVGTTTFGDGNFSIAASTGLTGTNCSIDTWMGIAAVVTYQIANASITQQTAFSSCTRTDFDSQYDGIHGTYAVGGSGITADYGFVLLSRGKDSGDDAGKFEYITAGIAYFGAEATNDSNDWNLTTGDYQDWNVSMNGVVGTNTLLLVNNQDEDSFPSAVAGSTGMGAVVDETTNWMIFANMTKATVFANITTPYTYYDDALQNTSANATLFQECNPSEAVKFTIANYAPNKGIRVRQQITDGYELASKDNSNFRLMAGSMLIAFLNANEPDYVGAVAEAAIERIAANPVLSLLIDRRDILTSAGAINIPPVALLEMIARTGALCVPEVVDLGGGSATKVGNDMLPVQLDNDGNIASVITYPGSSRPNYIVSGAAPFYKATSACETNQEDMYTSMIGIFAGFCADAKAKSVEVTVGNAVHTASVPVAVE